MNEINHYKLTNSKKEGRDAALIKSRQQALEDTWSKDQQ